MFDFFDPYGELEIREGNLPHWYQPGVTYFITFRTEDSVPKTLSSQWHGRRDEWLRQRKIKLKDLELHPAIAREYHSIFTREFMEYLDRGYGECILKKPNLAAEVAQAIMHFDEERYRVADYVVMPNHVHVLVGFWARRMSRRCASRGRRFPLERLIGSSANWADSGKRKASIIWSEVQRCSNIFVATLLTIRARQS